MASAIVEYVENETVKIRVLELEEFPASTIPSLHTSIMMDGVRLTVRNTGSRREMDELVSQFECGVIDVDESYARAKV